MSIEGYLRQTLDKLGLGDNEQAYVASIFLVIALTSAIIYWVLHRVVLNVVSDNVKDSQRIWAQALYRRKLFTRLALTLQGIIIYAQAYLWLDADAPALPVIGLITHLWVLLFGMLSFFSLLDTLEDISAASPSGRRLPLKGLFQGVKLTGSIFALIFAIALLIGKSPLILFSGLGAMTAILLLIFKDPILGLVAGIQLSANNMLALGDWLEMPKYGADGEVTDINLTTVKVRNWDKTITTIPTYALISDSFKNWRGMSESGGRRIKRAIYIDVTSVQFLDDHDLIRLRRAKLITDYIEQKIIEIAEHNRTHNVDDESPTNGRRLTNLGTLRAYLTAYIKSNQYINLIMTHMVRQLDPEPHGIPIQIYAFANTTEWLPYENIQADIFDHIFAILPEFGLRLYQSPTGHDMQQIGKSPPTLRLTPPTEQ
jgi:miniconductance mechanosensitive channel